MVWSRKKWNKSSYKVNKQRKYYSHEKIIFFNLLDFVCAVWMAEHTGAKHGLSPQMPVGIEKTIIRELKHLMSISYIETSTE